MTKAASITKAAASAAPLEVNLRVRSLWGDAWRQYRRHRLAMAGTVVFILMIIAVLFGPLIFKESTGDINFSQGMQGPSIQHFFGTDDLGRDIFARLLVGGRISIAVGMTAMLIAITLGTLIGSLAGFFGGRIDSFLMRVTDLFLALPVLPLLLLVIFLFRDAIRAMLGLELGIFLLIVAIIGILNWMPTARIVRASFMTVKQKEFVEAARCIGATTPSIMFRHILPNVMSPVIVAATLTVGSAIITESTLSFLGLGFPPDFPTWGRLLNDAQNYMELAPHMVIFPGLMIFLAVLSINYIGDGLRDALDPRRQR